MKPKTGMVSLFAVKFEMIRENTQNKTIKIKQNKNKHCKNYYISIIQFIGIESFEIPI